MKQGNLPQLFTQGGTMFAGHIGVALAIGRNEKRINVGVFVTAALFMDLVLWVFVLSGLESIVIPANFSSSHQPEYGFPYSHGLIASVLWSIVAAALGIFTCFRLGAAKWRAGGLIAISLFSHWVLDALVHQPELPLAGVGSSKVGFGLWQNMPVALVIESSLVLIGLFLFVRNSNLSRGKLIALGVLSLYGFR
jgi:hypothetical protein